MDDGIGLKAEWTMLLHSFLEDRTTTETSAIKDKIKLLNTTVTDLNEFKKDLSYQRQRFNIEIEKIKQRMDEVSAVIDNLKLVGSDYSDYVLEMDRLINEGEKISKEILSLDQKIRRLHELTDTLN